SKFYLHILFYLSIKCVYIYLLWQEAVIIKFTNAVCESFDKSWININNCRLRAINRNKTVFNLNITLLHPSNNIFVNMQVFKKANGYKPWLFKFTLDVCKFQRKLYNPTAILMYNVMKEYTNMNHSCPYVGDQILDGLYIRPELLRLPIPTGEYLIAGDWLFNNKKRLIVNVYATFIEDF
ncbi:hypothetical protein KR044_008387, partial [Drosophila immigrans]